MKRIFAILIFLAFWALPLPALAQVANIPRYYTDLLGTVPRGDLADANALTTLIDGNSNADLLHGHSGLAGTQSLTDGLAGKAGTQALTDGLASKAGTQALTDGLAAKLGTAAGGTARILISDANSNYQSVLPQGIGFTLSVSPTGTYSITGLPTLVGGSFSDADAQHAHGSLATYSDVGGLLCLGAGGAMPLANPVFSRPSTAYDSSGGTLLSDEPDLAKTLMVGRTDATVVLGQGVSGANLTPHCIAGGYLFYVTEDAHRIYAQASGSTTITRTNDAILYISKICGLSSGTILVCTDVNGSPASTVYRSTNQGTTLTPVLTLTTGAWVDFGDFHQAANGTIVLAEYGTLGTKIYRSTDDGATWATVYTATGEDAGQNRHFHAVGQQVATGRWVAMRGDNTNAKMLYSDDDGVTWAVLASLSLMSGKDLNALAFLDYGHPTRILCAEDGAGQVQWFDVLSLTHQMLLSDLDQRQAREYVMNVYSHDGLFYAGNWDGSGSGQQITIRVSPDLIHWASLVRVVGNYQAEIIGAFDDGAGEKIYVRSVDVSVGKWRTWRFSPPKVALREAVRVSPAATNALLDPNQSSFETSLGGWVAVSSVGTCSVARSTEQHWQGLASAKCVWTVKGAGYLLSPAITVEEGERYAGRVMIRGTV
ncbi:MAG: sialidase family protein, partial [Alphaproteobacteria bacterium]